jgi:hypothetical protein
MTDPDELYCLPLDRFVPERDALVKALRAENRREEAAAVAKLPKPSVAAWAVNQVIRAQPKQAGALWEAGDRVVEAQERVVAGKATGADLREAIEAQRAALNPLADAARGLVTGRDQFLGEQHVQAVVETLHAAAVDPVAREDVAAGRLARPLRLTGLEALPSGPAPAAPQPKRAAAKSGETEQTRTRIGEREQRDTAAEKERREAEKERAAQRKEAQRALVRAERDRDAARARVQDAVKARDEAAEKVKEAESELTLAESARADAHAELEQAEDAVDLAREELEGIE